MPNEILLVASSIVHLHGGRIGVFSAGEGKGTEFVVDIPIHRIESNRAMLKNNKSGGKLVSS